MSHSYLNNLAIIVEKEGPREIAKDSFPLRYGKYSAIRTSGYEFIFNLNGEIKFIRGLGSNWPHPAEQLKRTDGNDWVYYTVGDRSTGKGIVSWLGEYYLPCLPYPSNPIWEVDYLSREGIMNAVGAWYQLYANLYTEPKDGLHPKAVKLIGDIVENDDKTLHERSREMGSIIGGRVTVLPPDTRHVDYEIIPINISDGCLFHCTFCCVKTDQRYRSRSEADIVNQIERLKEFYGRNMENYNAVFLGNHDALAAGAELVVTAASHAYESFGFAARAMRPSLFLFGSATSLLALNDKSLEALQNLPFYLYINVGLESLDKLTLEHIGKPLSESMVREAFGKAVEINSSFDNIEVTTNFIIGKGLPDKHYESLKELLRDAPVPSTHGKGSVYLSPIKDSPKKRELLPLIEEIKEQSKLPVYVYLIQRL